MECAGCGATNREGARFCIGCGAPLVPTCPSCGAELPTDARFCDSCGASAPAAGAEREIAATRKTVTVLFSDLTGSTSLGERMDPESVRALMAPIYAAMRSEVESRGGHVSKFVGDGVMAVFGVPDVREDDALRSLEAALGMQAALDRLAADVAREHGAVLRLKVGVNTGEVVTGRGDEDLVGDCVNVASRLEGAAAPGEVLVGEETWRLTRGHVTYEPVAPLTLKGKSGPVPAYRLMSLEQTGEARTTTFVGRDAELARLTQAFEETVEANASRLVSIVGSPGLGKTRLTRELGAALDERALVIETRCDPGGAATFAPVADALRTAAGIGESASPDEVTDAIGSLVPEEPDRDRIVARAAALLGAGEPGSTEETFWAIRRIVETAARIRPMVLVLDDLHWGEPLLLDLVEHLAEWNRASPVLLVVTGRPELRDIRPSLVEGGRALEVIPLEGLDEDATERLACGLLGTDRVPPELVARLPASTEGNPLFVREFVRMLIDEGVLRRSNGAWVATIDVDAIEVPPTIQSLLAARVDRLDAPERTVLELASVVGKEFYRGVLRELAPAAVRVSLDAHLESLRRKEFVEPAGTYWIDEPVFRFHHALIRDAAYRRLLKESRAELHERVADWLEAKTAGVLGEHDELIGYHLEQAHESLRQLRSPGSQRDEHTQEIERRAAARLSSAARGALDRDDLQAAAALSRRALERLDFDDPERAETLVVRCESLLATGDVTAAVPAVAELESASASSPRFSAWATCFAGELTSLTDPSRLHEMEQRLAAAAEQLASLGDQAGAAKAHTVHGRTLARLGRVAESELAFDAGKNAASEAGDSRRITDVLGSALHAALWGPSPVSRAGGRCLDLVRLLRITTGSPAVEATSLRCQAVLEAFRGRSEAARKLLGNARRSVEELGLRRDLLETEYFAGIVELAAGSPAAAATHLREAHEGLRAMGVDVDAARAGALLARALLQLGEEDEADRFAAESERLAGHDLKAAIAWRAVRAEILARRGEHDEARRLAEAAVELASRTDALVDHGDACAALASVRRAAGDAGGAEAAERQARSLYERKGATALVAAVQVTGATEATVVTPPVSSGELSENMSARAVRRVIDRSVAHDWNGLAGVYAEDATWVDRRSGLATELVGRDPIIENHRAAADLGSARIDMTLLATRGETLSLTRCVFLGSDERLSYEVELLWLTEVAASGAVVAKTAYDPGDLDAAIAELDERFVAGEGASVAAMHRASMEVVRATNARDWISLRPLLSDDIVLVDHQPTSLGEIHGADAFIQVVRELAEVAPDMRIAITALPTFREDGCVGMLVNRDAATGAEIGYWCVVCMRDGLFARQERFPRDRLDLALARFEELRTASDATSGVPANRCYSAFLEFRGAFERSDWDAVERCFAGDASIEERRRDARAVFAGRARVLESVRSANPIGRTLVDSTLVATRGERLALVDQLFHGEDGRFGPFEVEALLLCELEPNGLISTTIAFEPDDLDSAMAELDVRYAAGEGASGAEVVQTWSRFSRAYNARDWEALRAMFADDLVTIDKRRPSTLGTMDADGYVLALRELIELIPGRRGFATTVRALSPTAAVTTYEARGATADGALIEETFQILWIVRGGTLAHCELYPEDGLDDALARFAELEREHATADENLSARAAASFAELFNRCDWDALSGLYANDIVSEDRRTGMRAGTAGLQPMMEQLKVISTLGTVHMRPRPVLATRGDRLSLCRVTWDIQRDGGDFEVDGLMVLEVDEDGRAVAVVTFDPGDIDAAYAELDDRFIASGEAPAWLRIGLEIARVLTVRDWDRFREFVTEDYVYVDHQPAGVGTLHGVDEYIRSVRTLLELLPEWRMTAPQIYVAEGSGGVVWVSERGEDGDGNPIAFDYASVLLFRDGRLARAENFPIERLDSALARFEELGRSDATRVGPPSNMATAALERCRESFAGRDWEAVASIFAPTCAGEDRRLGIRSSISGREHVLENMRAIASVGAAEFDQRAVAVRGDSLALSRLLYRATVDRGDFETEILQVTATDVEGGVSSFVVFDPADLDTAFDELDERYAAGEGAAYAELVAAAGRVRRARGAREWVAFRTALTDDFVILDRRPASFGTRTADEWVASWKVMDELATVRWDVAQIHAIDAEKAVVSLSVGGTTPEGASVEFDSLSIIAVRDGLLSYSEIFLPEQLDVALARFEELKASAPTT